MQSDALIEAVPNFSEGRRANVIDALAEAIQAPEVLLLNRSSDAHHNRTVLTVAGPPRAVLDGLFRATAVASQLIDLFDHQGVHPRLGATDVVPLVPLRNITLAECAALARELGEHIGQALELPVYLYEAAATRPERRNLADVRRGEFERLVAEINLPPRQPDFGPSRVGPAGAVIVGARPFLIAYNVYLQSEDVKIAQAISRQIRERDGGLPAVKALGLFVDGRAQVSMNIVDYKRTSLATVTERIAQLAAQYGTAIDHSELIGLAPLDAIVDVAAYCLKLPALTSDCLVEEAMFRARIATNPPAPEEP